jgi:hypothetical protein
MGVRHRDSFSHVRVYFGNSRAFTSSIAASVLGGRLAQRVDHFSIDNFLRLLNSPQSGPLATFATGIVAVVRIGEPIVREWWKTRSTDASLRDGITFRALHNLAIEQILENEKKFNTERDDWKTERTRLNKDIDELHKHIALLEKNGGGLP